MPTAVKGRLPAADLTPPPGADPARAAWDAFLERHPGTHTVELLLPDPVGVPRGKRVTADSFAGCLGRPGGLCFPTSLYAMDTTGANVEATGLVWHDGDADRPCIPDVTSLRPVPWRDGTAQVLGEVGNPDGSAFFADPRAVLRRTASRLAERGLTPVVALEYEFYLIRPTVDDAGAPSPPLDPATGRPLREVQVYSLDSLDGQSAFLDRLEAYAAAQGLPVRAAVAEYAPGQFEINLGHTADPVRAADDAFLLKRAVKAAARAAGLAATFMAKPYPHQSGSGLHVHTSLIDADGRNVFAGEAGDAVLRHAIGGLAATMAEAMPLFAPNANSYRRFRPMTYVALSPCWGRNNRTVALRVPHGPDAATRVEHRIAGADANPYLVLAAVLAGVHHGLANAIDPGPPVTGNAYATVPPSLPTTWDRALDAMATASVLPGYLGPDFWRVYHAGRAGERDRMADLIHPAEHAWYLHAV